MYTLVCILSSCFDFLPFFILFPGLPRNNIFCIYLEYFALTEKAAELCHHSAAPPVSPQEECLALYCRHCMLNRLQCKRQPIPRPLSNDKRNETETDSALSSFSCPPRPHQFLTKATMTPLHVVILLKTPIDEL